MKVLFVTDSPTVSGAEVVLLSHVEALAAAGGSAHVFLPAHNTRLLREFDKRRVPYTTTTSYSELVIRTTLNPAHLWHFAQRFRRVSRELAGLHRRETPDIVHSVSYPASLYAALALGTTGTPHVWHEHNIKRLHAANRRILRFVASRAARVIGPSDAVTGNLARAGVPVGKLQTIYNGIDLARFTRHADAVAAARHRLGLEPGRRAIALVGQLLPYKGHGLVIEAAPRILDRCPDARFFFVGALENPLYEAALRRHAATLHLEDRFVFTGWQADVPSIVGAMDVIVVPTVTPEPAALTLLEAMALGRPLVASRTGGTPELVVDGESGLLVPPGDVAALGAAVIELLADPQRAARMGELGRRRVTAHFTREAHLEAILRLYADLASSRADRADA